MTPACTVCGEIDCTPDFHSPGATIRPMTLADAITQVETAQSAYNNAVTQTASDQSQAAMIQAKLDAANQTVATDQAAQSAAATAFNAGIDQLIAAATAARIPVAGMPAPPSATPPVEPSPAPSAG